MNGETKKRFFVLHRQGSFEADLKILMAHFDDDSVGQLDILFDGFIVNAIPGLEAFYFLRGKDGLVVSFFRGNDGYSGLLQGI